jgi:uncharacterized protein (TIGR00369 family)
VLTQGCQQAPDTGHAVHEAKRLQKEFSAAGVFARFAIHPCSRLLGWTLLESDIKKGWARFSFEARPEFLNPAGFVQGGILSAMLDEAMGGTVMVISNGTLFTTTIDINVSFLAPAQPGRLFADGHVVQLGGSIAFVEARLTDSEGQLLARATSTSRLVPVDKLAA